MDRKTDNWVSKIKRIKQEMDDFKSTQFIGADSLIAYKTYTGSQFDYQTTLTSPNQVRYLRLTFQHQAATEGILSELKLFYRINNSNVMDLPVPKHTFGQPAIFVRWYKEMSNVTTGTQTSWRIRVLKNNSSDSFTAYFKFFIDGTDTGEWSVSVI